MNLKCCVCNYPLTKSGEKVYCCTKNTDHEYNITIKDDFFLLSGELESFNLIFKNKKDITQLHIYNNKNLYFYGEKVNIIIAPANFELPIFLNHEEINHFFEKYEMLK